MFDGFRAWLRGDDLNERMDRLNAPMLHYRDAAGSQIVRWEKGQPAWVRKNVRTYDQEAFRKASLIFACVQYMANAAGSVPMRVYQTVASGQKDEAVDHPLRQLMRSPNPGMGESRFLSFVTMVATISGYCVIEKERDRAGNVIGLWPLRPDWLRPIPRSTGDVDWQYTVPGYADPFIINAEDAISITYGDVPTHDPVGIGPVEVVLREAQIANELNDFIKVFLDRGAMPLYFAVPVKEGPLAQQWTKPETTDAFREKFRQTYGGLNNAADIMVAPAIEDIKPLGFNFNELAYRDLRDVSDLSITTAFGIPPILLGTSSGLAHATYANYEQARRSFWEDKLVPWLTRLDDAFTRHLMPEFWPNEGYDLRFDLSDVPAMKEDENQAHERARSDFTAGLVSRHIAQRMAGIDPHGMDSFLLPFSSVEVANANGERSAITATIERVVPQAIEAGIRSSGQRAAAETVARKNKEQIVRLAGLVEPVLTRFFNAQATRIVDAVVGERDGSPDIQTRAVENIDWDDENDQLQEDLRQWWGNVSEVAFADVSVLVGGTIAWDISNPYLTDLFDILGYRVRDINETTRQAVETIVRESLIEGTTMPDLADSLRDAVEETYRGRAESIARTESQVAYNTSSQRAYQASGVVQEVQMHDGVDCESGPGSDGLRCPDRNGMIVNVADMQRHISAEHPRGTLSFSPVLDPLEGE